MSDAPPPLPEEPPGPPEPPAREPFWGYSDVLLFAGLSIPCMLLGFVFAKALMYVLPLRAPMRAVEVLTAQLAGYIFLGATLMLILRVQYRKPFWVSLGWVEPRVRYTLLAFSGGGTAIVVALLAYLIGTPTTSNPMLELLKDRASILLVGIFGVTIGPLFEELAFRGFLQPLLVRSLGTVPGILAAALPFGVLHYWEYGKSWRHVLVISLAGAVFGWMRHVTGSTKASTIMHSAYNAMFFVALLAQKNAGV